jgi:lysophospholipase L1-like esterase
MKTVISILFLLIHATLSSQTLKLSQPVRFLALGDSYTIGSGIDPTESWPNQLYQRLVYAGYSRDKIQIIAQAGWRTDNLAKAIRETNPSSDFNLVSLLIGVNNQYQGASIEKYEEDFENLLKTAIKLAGGIKSSVFILSIPDYGYTPLWQGFSEVSSEIDKFNNINRKIAQDYDVKYFDITPVSRLGLSDPSLVSGDALHPSALMYTMWTDLIMEHIWNNNQLETVINETVIPEKIRIFPNPASNNVSVKIMPKDVSGNMSLSIYSLRGELKYRKDAINYNGSESVILELPALANGFYLVEVITDSDRTVKKIFIKGGGVQ